MPKLLKLLDMVKFFVINLLNKIIVEDMPIGVVGYLYDIFVINFKKN